MQALQEWVWAAAATYLARQLIFATNLLPTAPCARPAVTLVSQRWRRVFYSEPTLWQWLAVTAAPFPAHPRDTDGEALWLANKQALLDRVAPLVHTAVLRDGGNSNPLQLGSLIRHLQQAPLTQLTIELYRLTEEAVVAMGSLQQLTSLALTSQMLPPVPARLTTATRLAQLPARLPHLRSLTIEAAELPEAAVDSLLALPHLTYLRLHTIVGPLPPMQRLTALAALQHLSLLDESFDGTMTAVPVPEPACFPAIGVYSVCLEEGAEVGWRLGGSCMCRQDSAACQPVLPWRMARGPALAVPQPRHCFISSAPELPLPPSPAGGRCCAGVPAAQSQRTWLGPRAKLLWAEPECQL